MPITNVVQDEQHFKDHFQDTWTRTINQNAKGTAGLPVGIQVVSYPSQDECVLGIMKLLEDNVKFEVATLQEKSKLSNGIVTSMVDPSRAFYPTAGGPEQKEKDKQEV